MLQNIKEEKNRNQTEKNIPIKKELNEQDLSLVPTSGSLQRTSNYTFSLSTVTASKETYKLCRNMVILPGLRDFKENPLQKESV